MPVRHGKRLVVTSKFPITIKDGLVYLGCPKCGHRKPLMTSFGIRKMADGSLRNQPNCSDCRRRESKALRQTKIRTSVVSMHKMQ